MIDLIEIYLHWKPVGLRPAISRNLPKRQNSDGQLSSYRCIQINEQ